MGHGINFEKISRAKNEERKYVQQEIVDFNPRELGSLFYETLKASVDIKYQKDFNIKKVEGYFDPEREVIEILKIEPGQKKDEALAIFKLKLAEQQKGLALLKESLFTTISKNEGSDQLVFFLDNIIYDYEDEYKFSPNEMKHIKAVVAEFLERHKAVNDFFRENNGDPIKIYKEIFKIEPNGEIEIKKGLVSIAFICSNLVDYTRLYNHDYSGRNSRYISEEKIARANRSGGVFTLGAPTTHENLQHSIIGVKGNSWYKNEVIKHEEQHAIDRIYLDNIDVVELKNLQLSLWNSNNLKEAEELVIAFCKDKILQAGEFSKDEIIAFKIDREAGNKEILSHLIRRKSNMGLYDYLDVKKLLENIDMGLERFPENRKVYKKAEEILVYKYKKFIQEGIFSFDILKAKGYKEQGIVSVLMRERLDKWRKVADRMPLLDKENRMSVLFNSEIHGSNNKDEVAFHGYNTDNSAMEEALRVLKKKFDKN